MSAHTRPSFGFGTACRMAGLGLFISVADFPSEAAEADPAQLVDSGNGIQSEQAVAVGQAASSADPQARANFTELPQTQSLEVQPMPNPDVSVSGNPDMNPAALNAFRSDLDPYGRWLDDPNYGRVWVPSADYVGADFAPYVSAGQWGLDENENWAWMSDYPFGAVVFHYGRWIVIDGMGWAWIPGLSYAPAWVVWRVPVGDYAYVGWAPAPPTYGWFGNSYAWLVYRRPLPFVFCPSRYAFYSHFGGQLVKDRGFAQNLVHHTLWQSSPSGFGRSYSSPSLERARVPAAAVPSERIPASPRVATLPRAPGNPNRPVPTFNSGSRVAYRTPAASPSRSPFGASDRFGSTALSTRGFVGNPDHGFVGQPTSHVPKRPVITLGASASAGFARPAASSVGPSVAMHMPSRPIISLGSLSGSHYASASSLPTAQNHAPARFAGTMGSPMAARSLPSRFQVSPSVAPSTRWSAPRSAAPSVASTPMHSFSASSHTFSAPSHGFSSGRGFAGGGFGSGGFRAGGGFGSGGFRAGGGGGRRR